MAPKEIKREKLRVWKNVVVIAMSFMCLFTAYGVTAVLQVIEFQLEVRNGGSNLMLRLFVYRVHFIAKVDWE